MIPHFSSIAREFKLSSFFYSCINNFVGLICSLIILSATPMDHPLQPLNQQLDRYAPKNIKQALNYTKQFPAAEDMIYMPSY